MWMWITKRGAHFELQLNQTALANGGSLGPGQEATQEAPNASKTGLGNRAVHSGAICAIRTCVYNHNVMKNRRCTKHGGGVSPIEAT